MTDSSASPPFCRPFDAVAADRNVVITTGLSREDAARRLAQHGQNRLRQAPARGALSVLASQFKSVIVWLLAAAMIVSIAVGDHVEALAILVVLVLNGTIGFVTELRAVRSMEALQRMAIVRARVRREGQLAEIDSRHLVPGDIVMLDAGDVVSADLRLVEAAALEADESVLTGESAPVQKTTAPLGAGTALPDRTNMAFAGTAITRGSGLGIVTGTAMETELGRISALVDAAAPVASPVERRLSRLGHRLVALTLGLASLTIAAGILRGRDPAEMIETGIALAIAAVPEGLPVVATLCLARGMWRMAERNALVSELSAVETLGATTVILTDKTGTLTENRMEVSCYLLDDGRAEPGDPAPALKAALEAGVLCNNAGLDVGEKNGVGDPMEVALLAAADVARVDRADLTARHPEQQEFAFDPERLMMATAHGDGTDVLYAVKGAAAQVIEACRTIMTPDGPRELAAEERQAWAARETEMAGQGFRLLALAGKTVSEPADPYSDLTLYGVACLRDPLRGDVPSAIAAARAAGVRVVMLTGDHAATATAIARQSGLGQDPPRVRSGTVSASGTGDEDGDLLDTDVFARVSPETKMRLVRAYQSAGEVVAMTGDGVNDAPALRQADIGIAMGARGTDVAREAAVMVLRDDAFPTIVAAMREGRVIFDNLRKFVVYLMSCNLSEVLIVVIAVGAGLPAPLLPLQILFLNLVTDVFPAFALGFGRGGPDVMARPPRDPAEPIVTRAHWAKIGTLGALITLATLGTFLWAILRADLAAGQAVTVAFVTLALAQLWNVLNLRDPDAGPLRNDVTRNPWVWGAVLLCIMLIGAALLVPPLAEVLRLPFPGVPALLVALGGSLVPTLVWQAALLLRAAAR